MNIGFSIDGVTTQAIHSGHDFSADTGFADVARRTFNTYRGSALLFLASAFLAECGTVPALAAELAPKGAYVSTEITCAQFNAGDGNAMSLIEIDGMRLSSGKAYCDLTTTSKSNVYRAVCRAYPLPGATASSADIIEFEGEKIFKWIPPVTIEIDGGRQFKRCEITP